ncbi:MAG: FAD-binding oxidoreductase [Clostridiales Family XIII bacterium]|jgi:glycolate oxidase|nr:FAD-binding oxidoreductase [Clostridiales Family XIII bacterium]
MALNNDFYRALEDIVGKRNVSNDPAVTENYRCITAQSSAHYGPCDTRTPKPLAVVLPGSVEEVQLIVKLCNKYKVDFKAASTFWAAMGFIGSDNAIQLDMIRMDNVEIDAKNMIATCEPFAIGGTVQVEAMKNGLNCNIAGVGCSSSTLAGSAGWVGFGPSSMFMGIASENLLGAEWVLPDGESIRTGTLGSDGEWFCGEGPGPSPRAIFRGWTGTAGTMGVCTKIAIRLHPWPGPKWIPVRGTAPAYFADGLDNVRAYTICYPDWDAYAESFRLFYEADICYLAHRQFNMFGRDIKTAMVEIFTHPEKQFCDIPDLVNDPYLKEQNEQMRVDVQVVLAGFTERDLDYKEKAFDAILEQVGAHKSEYYLQQDIEDFVKLYLIRLARKNYNYTLCSSYEGNFGLSGNVFVAAPLMEEAAALKLEWEQTHTGVAAVGGDSDMGSVSGIGGGGTTGWEFFVHFDGFDKESIYDSYAHIERTQEWMTEKGLGIDFGRWNSDARQSDGYNFTQEQHDSFYSKLAQPPIAEYQWRIRESFNPNHLTGSYYKTLTPKEYQQKKK